MPWECDAVSQSVRITSSRATNAKRPEWLGHFGIRFFFFSSHSIRFQVAASTKAVDLVALSVSIFLVSSRMHNYRTFEACDLCLHLRHHCIIQSELLSESSNWNTFSRKWWLMNIFHTWIRQQIHSRLLIDIFYGQQSRNIPPQCHSNWIFFSA